MQETEKPSFRRQVFFISGFDPRGALFLHKNCVDETAKWSAVTGHKVETGARKNIGKVVRRWQINAELPSGKAETTFDFLQWDDIIRQHWDKRTWLVYLQSLGMLWRLMLDGVFFRTIRESWPIAIVIAAPAVVALLHGLGVLLPVVGLLGLYLFPGMIGKAIAILLMALGGLALWWVRTNMDQYKADWNGRICIFSNKMVLSRGEIASLDERLNQMADHIVAAIEEGKPDEALIIGHSFGTALCTIVAARVLERRPDWGSQDSPLGLVTLGQTQALSSYRKRRTWYHDEVARFANFPDFTWLDFSSPPDGACYAMVNVLDFLPNPPKKLPKMLNAQFHRGFTLEHMNAARANRMQMHFFYMQANDVVELDSDLYDFVLLIAGTQMARDRYRDRPSAAKPFFRKG
jgi:pimeloyl-ACP methyl ester carboxylesterase